VRIIAATLNVVAAIDKRIMNLEKDRCLLKAIRLAMSNENPNGMILVKIRMAGQSRMFTYC